MSGFKGEFTRIKDLSDRRRLPRLGKIRLGVKSITKDGKEYPRETPYFVCPPEVEAIYGPEPLELDVMFPVNNPEIIFPQRLIWYGASKGAKCMGNGEQALRLNDKTGEMEERSCPCVERGKNCFERGHLLVILHKVNMGGVYQIDLGSYHSIVDLNSGLDFIEELIGRISMVPLKLRRVPRETHGSGRKEIHYTLTISFEGDIDFVNALRENTGRILAAPVLSLPAPEIQDPATDPEAIVETVEEPPVDAPPDDAWPTEAEALEMAKEAGMVPPEKPYEEPGPPPKPDPKPTSPEPTPDQKAAWRKELDGYIAGVEGFSDGQALNKWFVRLKKESGLPDRYLNELGVRVTEKLRKLTAKK